MEGVGVDEKAVWSYPIQEGWQKGTLYKLLTGGGEVRCSRWRYRRHGDGAGRKCACGRPGDLGAGQRAEAAGEGGTDLGSRQRTVLVARQHAPWVQSAALKGAQGGRMAMRRGLSSVLSALKQPLSTLEGVLAPLQPYSLLQPVRATGSSHTVIASPPLSVT